MKKLFVVLCDILAIAAVVAVVSLALWVFAALFGAPVTGAVKTVCVAAAIVTAAATVGAFIAWKNGGAPGGDDPGPSPWEGEE